MWKILRFFLFSLHFRTKGKNLNICFAPKHAHERFGRAQLNILTPLTGVFMLLMPSLGEKERARRIKYHRVCTTWYLFSFYFKYCISMRRRRRRRVWVEESSRVLWKNFCVEKHNNFNIAILQEKREKARMLDGRTVYNRFCRKHNQKRNRRRRVAEFETHFNPFPALVQLDGFLCNANSFFELHRENCFHFQWAAQSWGGRRTWGSFTV